MSRDRTLTNRQDSPPVARPGTGSIHCRVCSGLAAKLNRARERHDHSAVSDCRVLLKRHLPDCPAHRGANGS